MHELRVCNNVDYVMSHEFMTTNLKKDPIECKHGLLHTNPLV